MRWGARDMSETPTDQLYELHFEHFPDHLYVYVKIARLTEQAVIAYLREIANKAQSEGYQRVMIVRDIRSSLPDMVNYRVSQATLDWFKGVRMAWVNPHPEQNAAIQFFTDVASNRGGNYRLFSDTDTARRWLLR